MPFFTLQYAFFDVLLYLVLLGPFQPHRIGRRASNPTVTLLVVYLGGVRYFLHPATPLCRAVLTFYFFLLLLRSIFVNNNLELATDRSTIPFCCGLPPSVRIFPMSLFLIKALTAPLNAPPSSVRIDFVSGLPNSALTLSSTFRHLTAVL